jgi:hypothetical protein
MVMDATENECRAAWVLATIACNMGKNFGSEAICWWVCWDHGIVFPHEDACNEKYMTVSLDNLRACSRMLCHSNRVSIELPGKMRRRVS